MQREAWSVCQTRQDHPRAKWRDVIVLFQDQPHLVSLSQVATEQDAKPPRHQEKVLVKPLPCWAGHRWQQEGQLWNGEENIASFKLLTFESSVCFVRFVLSLCVSFIVFVLLIITREKVLYDCMYIYDIGNSQHQ